MANPKKRKLPHQDPSRNYKNARTSSTTFDADDENGRGIGGGERRARVDATTGMRSAFPELDELEDGDGDELFYGPANTGVEYLRMVRSEAKGVPDLLVAPKHHDEVNGDHYEADGAGSGGGYYFDGAYTAAPDTGTSAENHHSSGEEEDEVANAAEAQRAFDSTLLLRYRLLRANLRCTPPPEVLARADARTHPSHVRGSSKAELSRWRHLLRTTTPSPLQLALMDQESIFALLKIVTASFVKRKENLETRESCWIWSLLGRIEEAGCLTSEEVGDVRDLGKKAVWVLEGVRRKAAADRELEDRENEESDEGRDENSDVKMAESIAQTANYTNREGSPDIKGSSGSLRASQEEKNDEDGTEQDIDAIKARLIAQLPKSNTAPSSESQEHRDTTPLDHTKSNTGADRAKSESDEAEEGEIEEEPAPPGTTTVKPSPLNAKATTTKEPFPSQNTLATLYMIITIVGECYGQRDLLEYRQAWTEILRH